MDVLNAIACSLWEPVIIADDESSRSVMQGTACVSAIVAPHVVDMGREMSYRYR